MTMNFKCQKANEVGKIWVNFYWTILSRKRVL